MSRTVALQHPLRLFIVETEIFFVDRRQAVTLRMAGVAYLYASMHLPYHFLVRVWFFGVFFTQSSQGDVCLPAEDAP